MRSVVYTKPIGFAFFPWECGILVSWEEIEPTPHAVKCELLTTGSPSKSPPYGVCDGQLIRPIRQQLFFKSFICRKVVVLLFLFFQKILQQFATGWLPTCGALVSIMHVCGFLMQNLKYGQKQQEASAVQYICITSCHNCRPRSHLVSTTALTYLCSAYYTAG